MRDRTSYSELSTLADCERKWAYRYRDGEKSAQTAAMFRGSALHDLIGAWRQGDEQPALTRLWDSEGTEEELQDIIWIFERYRKRYADDAHRTVATELKLVSPLPGTDVEVVTYIDEIIQSPGQGLWAIERKTMKDWRRLDQLVVDPQVSIVLWQLEQHGWPVKGLIYDAIRTYRWKPTQPTLKQIEEDIGDDLVGDPQGITKTQLRAEAKRRQGTYVGVERPLEDSFRWYPLTRSPEHIEAAVREMQGAVLRRAMLGAGALPLRSIGQQCGWCDHQYECWTELANQDVVLIPEEDDGQ